MYQHSLQEIINVKVCPPNSSIEAKRELLNQALAKRSTQRLTLMLKSVLCSILTEHFKRFAKLEHAFYYLSGRKGETTSGSSHREGAFVSPVPSLNNYYVSSWFCHRCLGFHEQHATTWIWHSHTIALANKVQRQVQDLYN